jgi:hypothetical protein
MVKGCSNKSLEKVCVTHRKAVESFRGEVMWNEQFEEPGLGQTGTCCWQTEEAGYKLSLVEEYLFIIRVPERH